MADTELFPWEEAAKSKKDDKTANMMPWEEAASKQPGVVEDVAKGGAVGLAQGVIALPGMGGDLQELAKAGTDAAMVSKPMGWLTGLIPDVITQKVGQIRDNLKKESDKAASTPMGQTLVDHSTGVALPSSADIQGQVEKVTGPFYQAQTPAGKIAQTTGQVAPALATGGVGSARAAATVGAKALGAGVASEGAGEAADALKGHLPTAMQPYAEPVARAGGAILGTGIPGLARKVVTPLPMTDERLATVNALRATNPELVNASSAGQLTESPRIAGLEARSPQMADLPQRQSEAYTQGVMRQAGAPGEMFTDQGMAIAKAKGGDLQQLQDAHTMSPAEFANLKSGLRQDYIGLQTKAGDAAAPLLNFNQDVRLGPNRSIVDWKDPANRHLMPTEMPGSRFGILKKQAQAAGDAASPSDVATALYGARQRLKEAFHNSMPPDEAARLQALDQGYSNYASIAGIKPKAGQTTITPDQVAGRAPRGSEMKTHADQASSVMTPLPKPTEGGPASRVVGSLIGGALGGAGGYATGGKLGLGSEGLLGAFYGAGHAPDYLAAAKNTAGRVVAQPWMQDYLKNQRFRPDPNRDRAAMARILMTPPVKAVTDQSQ